jgi:23S rRNA pseudouridine2605 synthase
MEIRLQKYLADAGVASRRASVELIKAGKIKVNGRVKMRKIAKSYSTL